MELSESLMDLFMTYQIPSDMLSYNAMDISDEPAGAKCVNGSSSRMVEAVRKHALTIQVYVWLGRAVYMCDMCNLLSLLCL